jgi:tryptophan-rich sensory protein
MKRPALIGHSLASKAIITVLALVLGFFAHIAWVKRQQIIEIWNNLFLYYQD